MISKLKDNLASIAALIAAVVAIGGGFVKYGEITTKLNPQSPKSMKPPPKSSPNHRDH